MEQKV